MKTKNFPPLLKFSWGRNIPTEEQMEKFFSDEVVSERLLWCPKINKDITDDWGMFGYEPGFIFVEGPYAGRSVEDKPQTLSEYFWGKGLIQFDEKLGMHAIPEYGMFPIYKFSCELITQEKNPAVWDFLKKKFLLSKG